MLSLLDEMLDDPRAHGRLILGLQRGISSEFTTTDWQELGYSAGQHQYIQHHDRLLRSLHFGDDDYGASVFQVLEYFARDQRHVIMLLINHPKVRGALLRTMPEVASLVRIDDDPVLASVPSSVATGDVIQRAMADAEQLILTSGPVSAVDRLHTALHGYLRMLCSECGAQVAEDASLTALFKTMRAEHPALKFLGPHDKEMVKVLNGFANAIDAINALRNNGSVAHPSEHLLGEAEAYLAVNATRTVLNYIRAKLGH